MALVALLGFGGVVVLALLLLHGYLWWRLVRGTTRPGRVRRVLTVLTAVLALLPAAAVLGRRSLSFAAQTPLDWVGYTWLGVAFYLFLATLALEPVRVVLWLARRPRRPGGDAVADPSRRVLLARGLALTAGAVAVGTAGYGVRTATGPPVVRRVPVTLAGLDPALDGYRIVTFSDAHLSPTNRRSRLARVVDLVNAQRPDTVAIVGDLVDGEVAELRRDVEPLADLVAAQGVFFVTGNHEYFVDTEAWVRHLPTLGVDVLRNERVELRRGAAAVDLAGIDDRTAASSGVPGHGADLGRALAGRDPSRPVVLLAHQPVQVRQAEAAGVDLQLSGHTHGGQLWPFGYAVRLDQPVVSGLARYGRTQLYVTSGAGYWGPPMRVGARPEVTVIELRSPLSR
jgi:predicted MPP superfamily phosphohydrolase